MWTDAQQQHNQKLDELRDQIRETQSQFRGPNYWLEPKETTGPHDPFPGHAVSCERRLGRPYCSANCELSDERKRR